MSGQKTPAAGNDFNALLDELDVMAKSMPGEGDDDGDDGKIRAAAEEGKGGDADSDGDADNKGGASDGDADNQGGEGEGGGEGEDDGLTKSFQLELEDGTVVEALDGTELVKALIAKNETLMAQNAELTARADKVEEGFAKALGSFIDGMKGRDAIISEQGKMLKSLEARVEELAGQGRGRKTTVSVTEKPAPMQKSLGEGNQPEGIPANEFMAKALSAQSAGKLTGLEVARAESYLNRGLQVPGDIVAKVVAHQG